MDEEKLTLQKAIEDFITDRELNSHTEKTITTRFRLPRLEEKFIPLRG